MFVLSKVAQVTMESGVVLPNHADGNPISDLDLPGDGSRKGILDGLK